MTDEEYIETRKCIRCRVELPLTNYRVKSGKKGGYNLTCNDCLQYHKKFIQSKNLQPVNFVSVSEHNKYPKQRLLGVVLKKFHEEIKTELDPHPCATHQIKACPKCLSSTICKHMTDLLKVCKTTQNLR